MKEAMARRRKLNIRHRASDNEGIQSTSNNTNSTNVEGSNVAETRSSPCHAEGVIRESVESHSIPSDIEVEEEQIEKEVEPKRARGPTKMLDVWEMEHGDLIIVNLDKYGRPIGEEGTTLTRFIGSVARRYQYAPINYKSWKVMPNDYKEEMLKLIESKFEFVPPINDLTREMLKSELNEKWRQWKGDLKSMAYDPTKTEEEVASLVPDDRVDLFDSSSTSSGRTPSPQPPSSPAKRVSIPTHKVLAKDKGKAIAIDQGTTKKRKVPQSEKLMGDAMKGTTQKKKETISSPQPNKIQPPKSKPVEDVVLPPVFLNRKIHEKSIQGSLELSTPTSHSQLLELSLK
uniref:Uncharacterized protein LOC101507438 n=1 Tax=Cicer arietinum TaxID=3827 RepID=A0A3Q7YC56_CICAR|nr:uncharacterized protein LOC101507438 [Cicer arietinum]